MQICSIHSMVPSILHANDTVKIFWDQNVFKKVDHELVIKAYIYDFHIILPFLKHPDSLYLLT